MHELIPDPAPATTLTGVNYAGFWRRFNAYGIDATIIWLACILLQYFFFPDTLVATAAHGPDDLQQLQDLLMAAQTGQLSPALLSQAQSSLFDSALGGSILGADTKVMILVSALYNIWFAIGTWQGTPGKHWLKMKIVMLDGSRLTLQQSALRHAATAISAVAWMLPCLTIFFTRDRLAPHDMLCGTRVIHTHQP